MKSSLLSIISLLQGRAMKAILCAAMVLALAAGVSYGDDKPLSFTADGVSYTNVTVTGSDATSISVMTDSGIAHIPLTSLPDDLQNRFGYDPLKAAKFAQDQRAAKFAASGTLDPLNYPEEIRAKVEEYNTGISSSPDDDKKTDLNILKDDLDAYTKYLGYETDKDLIQRTREAVANHTYFIGIYDAAFALSYGEPVRINYTDTEHNSFDQWIYPNDTYFYFQNSMLTASQN